MAYEYAKSTGRRELLNEQTAEFIAKNWPSANNGHDGAIDAQITEHIEREEAEADAFYDFYK